jgi:hypothetical protein
MPSNGSQIWAIGPKLRRQKPECGRGEGVGRGGPSGCNGTRLGVSDAVKGNRSERRNPFAPCLGDSGRGEGGDEWEHARAKGRDGWIRPSPETMEAGDAQQWVASGSHRSQARRTSSLECGRGKESGGEWGCFEWGRDGAHLRRDVPVACGADRTVPDHPVSRPGGCGCAACR